MALSISEAYTRVLQEVDKETSDFFPLLVVLSQFKTQTYGFIGARAKQIEETQTISEDLKNLVTLGKLDANASTVEESCYISAIPINYLHHVNIRIRYSDDTFARECKMERHGETNNNIVDPFKKVARGYVRIQKMQDFFKIYTGGQVVGKTWLTYLKHPIFGNNQSEMIVDLPITAVLEIIKMTATALMVRTDNPVGQINLQTASMYRNLPKE